MAIPSKKSLEIEELLERTFARTTLISADRCTNCLKDAKIFRNEISKKEYTISGFCQDCQDKVFGK